MSTGNYSTKVLWSDEDNGYIAIALELPGCSAFGETETAALEELNDAIAAWLEARAKADASEPRPPIFPAEWLDDAQ